MSEALIILFALLVAIIGLPILTYIVVKFGSAAFFREKQRYDDRNKQH